MNDGQRVMVYVDGFNLYYGMKSAGLRRYLWLDLHELSMRFLLPGQVLAGTKYFTARVSGTPWDPHKHRRQNVFLEALRTRPDINIILGKYLTKKVTCKKCGNTWNTFEEKMTDVNIAVELLEDAHSNAFDVAIIVSGDSDLVGPVRRLSSAFPEKRVVVAFPPARDSVDLRKATHAYFKVGQDKLRASQFADEVVKPDGYVLRRPKEWK